jgi:hypothetical protein
MRSAPDAEEDEPELSPKERAAQLLFTPQRLLLRDDKSRWNGAQGTLVALK